MQYLTCPRCHSSVRSSVMYQAPKACPRCGAPFHSARPSIWQHLREGVNFGVQSDAPDWETITGSQYTNQHVVRRDPKRNGDKRAPA